MFELGPEKIIAILGVALVCLGPQELPMAARKIGAVIRQLRVWQDDLRNEVAGALQLDAESFLPEVSPPPADVSDPRPGDSFG